MKLSIIIPVYNLEKYIQRCIDSIYSQDVDNSEFEVIFVDDGSTDNSSSIIRRIPYNNFKLIYQENARQGAARNNALGHAKGDYVWFVDGDDIIANGCLLKVLKIIENNQFDILFYKNKKRTNTHIETVDCPTKIKLSYFTGEEYLHERRLSLGPCYIFNRKFLLSNNLFFTERVFFEDSEYMPKVCFMAKNIIEADFTPYIIFFREGSTTNTISLRHATDSLKITGNLASFAMQNAKTASFPDLAYYSAMIFNTFFKIYRTLGKAERNKIKISNTFKKNILNCFRSSKHLKYLFEWLFLSVFFNTLFNKENSQ